MPGGLHQQAAGVAVSGLGDACAGVTLARLVLDRDEPEVGADRAPRKAVPITDLDRQPEGGEGTHPAKTAKPRHDLGPARLGREPLDLGIEGIATRERGKDGRVVVLLGSAGPCVLQSNGPQPLIVALGPRSTLVDVPVAEQEL